MNDGGKMNKNSVYPWAGAVIGIAIGFAVVSMMRNRQGFLFNETLLNMVIIGTGVGASVGAFLSAVGGFAVIPPYISLIFIIPAFLILGYHAGMIIANNKFRLHSDTAPGVR
ncbi:MAG: hypothetical protein WAW23_03760 [Candidatus Methanoperedens sp.]